MGYVILFVFYVMVGIVTYDMHRITRRPRALEAGSRPARRPATPPLVAAFGRMLRERNRPRRLYATHT